MGHEVPSNRVLTKGALTPDPYESVSDTGLPYVPTLPRVTDHRRTYVSRYPTNCDSGYTVDFLSENTSGDLETPKEGSIFSLIQVKD